MKAIPKVYVIGVGMTKVRTNTLLSKNCIKQKRKVNAALTPKALYYSSRFR